MAETELGGLYRMAIELGLKPPKHAGEISIIEWLSEHLSAGGLGALVVFEDARVPRLLGRERFPVEVVALTTRSFLVFAQDQGILCSAEDAWHAIEAQVPNARGTFLHSTKRPEP